MSGLAIHETIEDIESFWDKHAADRVEKGFPPYATAPGRTERVKSAKHLKAYISDSRWVADCAAATCHGGLACWPEHDFACCLDCGTVYRIDFPSRQERHDAEEALLVRPEENRNWRPHEGETPEQLRHENIAYGFVPRGGEPDWKQKLAEEHGVSVGLVDEILDSAKREGKSK